MSKLKNKKSILCLLMAGILFASCFFNTLDSSAISAWAEKEVTEAIGLGLIPADMQTDYTENITRAEFCRLTVVLLENIYGMTIEDILSKRGLIIDNTVFTDTQDTDILTANALGIVFGDGKGIFNPHGEIKRGEAAAMLMRTASLTGEYPALPHVFDDAAWFPAWARDSAYTAYAYGIMVGDNMNRFHPVSFYTRQETYATILRLYHTILQGAKEKEVLYPMSKKNEEGLCLWGYINQSGLFMIEPKYAYASEWNGQYGIVAPLDAPDAHFVIDREESHVLEINELRELMFGADKIPPHFLGNTLYVGGYEKVLFSLPDGKWLTGDYKGGGASYIMDGAIRSLDGFDKRWYYLDRNGKPIIPREEGFWFAGFFYKDDVVVGDSSGMGYWLLSKDGEKKPIITDAKEAFFPDSWKTVGDLMTVPGPHRMLGYDLLPNLYGVIRADGKEILPPEYEILSITQSKQILARKNVSEPYSLFDESGKKIYEFGIEFGGELLFDGIGHYMFPLEDTKLAVLSNTGAMTANISIARDASFSFISGLVQVIDASGACKYYTVQGEELFSR